MAALFRTLLLSSALYLCLLATSNATTIALIRNDEGVYIGADSRTVNQFGEALASECKITRMGDYYFAHAGLGLDSTFGFDIKAIAREVFTADLAFPEHIERFIESVDTEFSRYLNAIRTKRPNLFSRISQGQVNIETAIAGRDTAGQPFFKVIKFTAADSARIKITPAVQYSCPGNCSGDQAVVLLGQMSQAGAMVDRWAGGMLRNPVRAINAMIGREIQHSDRVGGPVAILKITESETIWVQHNELCENL